MLGLGSSICLAADRAPTGPRDKPEDDGVRYPAPTFTDSFGGFFNVCRMTQ